MSSSRREFLAALGVAAVGTGTATADHAPDAWGLPRGDHGNTGHAPVEGPTGPVGVDWTYGRDGALTAYPVPFRRRGFLGYEDGAVVALDTTSGSATDLTRLDETPTLAITPSSDRLFVPTQEGTVHALDPDSGAGLWRRSVGESLASPVTLAGDAVLFGTEDGTVFALDAGDGETRWKRSLDADGRTTPAVADGTVVVRASDGRVRALDGETGETRWDRPGAGPSGPGRFDGPAIRDGRVFVETAGGGSGDGRLAAFDLRTGDPVWRRSVRGTVLQLVSRPDRVVAFHGSAVHAHDPADGSVLWRAPQEREVRLASGSDALYALSEDALAVYDPTDGREVDRFDPDGRPTDRLPVVGRDVALVGGPFPTPGGVLAVDDGDRVWRLRGGAGGTDLAAPVVGAVGAVGALAYAVRRVRGGGG